MGIETALLAMGMSAGTAAAVSTGLGVLGAAGAVKSLTQKPPAVNIQQPEPPPKPQASKAPDRTAAVAANAAAAGMGGARAGNSSTFLTGPSGVDPSTLNLGKNTLLGQ